MVTSDRSRIRKAVIPAAGHGTRLRPLTSITPKEMLPLGRKPAVEYIVEELHAVGINDIIFVVSPLKPRIQEYFGDSTCQGKVRVRYVIQEPQRGLADAILQAEEAVAGEHFVVALGDSVIVSQQKVAPLARLMAAYQAEPAFAAITVERVPIEDSYRYGMVKPAANSLGADGEPFEIDGLVEKPKAEESPSEYAIAGRYIFASKIFDCIRRTPPGVGGELQITDSIKLGLAEGELVWCSPLLTGERRYDIGNFQTFCEAFTAVCMLDAELAPLVRKAAQRGKTVDGGQ